MGFSECVHCGLQLGSDCRCGEDTMRIVYYTQGGAAYHFDPSCEWLGHGREEVVGVRPGARFPQRLPLSDAEMRGLELCGRCQERQVRPAPAAEVFD
ncbi:hypothetical protein [Salininema proteolyticum]|uniref:Uncharacterized protein n=1 Tax=Salininema proteolyticum TaxID=1607685 RepID=A0ABV8TUU6_9ACTN